MNHFFSSNDYYELLALHRVILQAKFTSSPEDRDIPPSPIVANISKRLVQALKQAEIERGKPEKVEGWENWLKIKPEHQFWKNAVEYATSDLDWKKLDNSDKPQYVETILSPFTANQAQVEAFIKEVDTRSNDLT